ncbi:hypothetical protein OF364_01445 [Mycoplasma enhydrae]|uniref:hypothetical protein n=1 Tax=Mycoplasma enhydrae TaxID=2499220 RepID=UPI00197C8BCE|nr:hypothetical protein [Mycoplasma enhydrae]MBN4089293.1 hypothetical protein [Mycoplasma enhydrae]MCV3733547.1 hypothetical protein [Mycoplasma enhydrae]MCV3753477.1 hypothetical protein [Mycoplasma enhydrae]
MKKFLLLNSLMISAIPISILSISCCRFPKYNKKELHEEIEKTKGLKIVSISAPLLKGPIEPAYKKNDIIFSLEDKSKDPNYQSITIKDFKGQKNQEKTIYFLIPYKEKLKYKNKELTYFYMPGRWMNYRKNKHLSFTWCIGYKYIGKEKESEYYFEGEENKKITINLKVKILISNRFNELHLTLNDTSQILIVEEI